MPVIDDDFFAGGEIDGVDGAVTGNEYCAAPLDVEQEEARARKQPLGEALRFRVQLQLRRESRLSE